MSYLDRLKKSASAGGGTLQNHQNPESRGFVGFEGTPPAPFQKIEGARAANDPGQKQPLARPAEAFTAWLLHFTDRESFEVLFSPPAHLAEVLTAYPAAVAAEPARQHESGTEEGVTPTPPPRNAPAASCRTCRHLKRPGLSAGYCGGRSDLPPAYGPGHPLRRLPDDGGASCTTWEASR